MLSASSMMSYVESVFDVTFVKQFDEVNVGGMKHTEIV